MFTIIQTKKLKKTTKRRIKLQKAREIQRIVLFVHVTKSFRASKGI